MGITESQPTPDKCEIIKERARTVEQFVWGIMPEATTVSHKVYGHFVTFYAQSKLWKTRAHVTVIDLLHNPFYADHVAEFVVDRMKRAIST